MIAAVCGAALTATPSFAQQVCLPRADPIFARLNSQFGEILTEAGVDARGNLVRIFSSPETGTWTLLVTRPDGLTCIMAAGEGWDRNPEPLKLGQPS